MEGENDHNDSNDIKKVMKKVPFHWLFSFTDPVDHSLMFLGSVSAIGHGFSMPLMSVIFGELVDTFGEADNTRKVVNAVSKVALKFLYLAIGSGIAACVQVACWMVAGERQASRIRSLYLKTLLRQEVGFFDQEDNAGEILGRMSGDTVVIQEAIGAKVGKCIQLVATFLGGFALAVFKGWQLTLVLLSLIPAVVLAGAVLSFTIEKIASQGQNAYAVAASVIGQTIGSIRTVASFTGENRAIAKYEESLVKAYNSSIKSGFASGLGFGAVMCIVFCTYGLAVWFGGKMILEKGYTGGDVINVIFAIVTGSMALGEVSPCITAFVAGQAAAFKMFEAIERKPRIDASLTDGKKLDDIQGEIELRDVDFSYPSRPHQQKFSGFSLIIPSGTTAALVGGSGSGKSTIISLIERFYDPDAGAVLIDGVNLKEFQLKWIRQKISLVSQEPVLFATTIRANLLYGKDEATMDEITGAIKLANAAKFINNLPQGLDTMVGEHGTLLSGGQKQRIAIARAILKNPKILLLDEATSALDTESEKKVQKALDRFMVNRTTVIIAHRLSTVRNADTIAVIQDGKVIEKGSHSELTRDPDGAYSQLIRLQTIPNVSDQIEVANTHGPRISIHHRRSSSQSPFLQFLRSMVSPQILKEEENECDITSSEPVPFQKYTMQSISPLWRVASLAKSETLLLVLGSVAAVGLGVILPVFGYLLSNMIKTFFEPPHELRKDSKYWAYIFVTIGMISLVLQPMRTHFFTIAAAKLMGRIRKDCFRKVVHMEIGWFDEVEQSTSAVCKVLSEDASAVQSLVADGVSLVIQNSASAIGAVAVSSMVNWQLALVIISLLPFLGVNNYIEFKLMKGFGDRSKKLFSEASQVAHEAVGSIRTVASFCAEEKVMELYRTKCQGPVKSGMRHGIISGIGFGASMFLLYSVYATSFYTGAIFVEQGKINITDVFHVFFVLTMSCVAIAYSSSLLPDIAKTRSAAASMFETLDRKSIIDSTDESGLTIPNLMGEIEFQHVSFKYPSRPNARIFQNLCLTIQSSQTLALVGESGSGKSTVISLLQRFHDPDAGSILIDGVDIRKMQLKWLRRQMGLVSQEPMLFNDTIRANIAYAKEDNVTEAEIVAAAKLANAHNFICGLEQGYNTIVGERGIQLSGGQKQRVAIARAILKVPKILLLDEATSALDAESERFVQEALDKVAVNRTTVVVAHRLSTIRNANLIAVVKNGGIVEIGSHESLVNRTGGIYASLVALQSGAEPK